MYGNVIAGKPFGVPHANKGGLPAQFLGPSGTSSSSYPLGIAGAAAASIGSHKNLETFEVLHKFVALRSGPSVESKHLGRLEQGMRVRGQVTQMGQDPWLRLAPQRLPELQQLKGQGKSLRDVRAEDEVWVMIDATNLGLNGLGVLLKRVEEEVEEELSEWKVVHKQIAIRKEASLTSAVLGYHARGDRVKGVTQNVGGVPWLKIHRRDERSTATQGWMLIDGGALGLGPLLKELFEGASSGSEEEEEPQPKAKAKAKPKAKSADAQAKAKAAEPPPKAKAGQPEAKAKAVAPPKAAAPEPKAAPGAEAKGPPAVPKALAAAAEELPDDEAAKARAKAKAAVLAAKTKAKAKARQLENHELGDLSKWIYHDRGKLGRFKVAHEQVVVRNMPSVRGKMKGIVMRGDFLQGEQRDEWLLLDWEVSPLDLLEGKGRWALIDGKSVGFGLLLERAGEANPSASAIYTRAMEGPAAQPAGERLPRVLCLHGAASGQAILSIQLSFLARRAQGLVDLVFLDGPRDCTDLEAVRIMSGFFRGKPMKMFDEPAFDEKNWLCYKQPRTAVKWLQEKLQELAPIDAVLGFSQGADFATMLAAQASKSDGVRISAVALLCPHAPGYVKYMEDLFNADIKVPAFVLRGEQEDYDEAMKETLRGKVINKMGYQKPSEHVLRLFETSEVATHGDGHRPLPEDKQEAERIVEQLLSFLVRHARKGPLLTAKAEVSSEFKEGATVRLVGLEKVAHLNKQEGTLQRFDSETERWVLSLQNTGEQVMLKEKNLEIVKDQCVVCKEAVGFKKGDDGERYCSRCWPTVSCRVCRKALGTEKGEDNNLYCKPCWAKRVCVKCNTAMGEVQSPEGERYCKKCWNDVCCTDCRKALAVRKEKDRFFCADCWKAKACVRCDQAIGTIKEEQHGTRYCSDCWEISACMACKKRLGDVRDVKRDNYCSPCWTQLSCVLCSKAVGTVKDSEDRPHCQACWEKFRLCVRCQSSLGTHREGGKQYCADCHYLVSLCAKCGERPGEPRPAADHVRFCEACWTVRERERVELDRRRQGQLFRDVLGICEALPGPPLLPGRPGSPELPREAGDFLRRFHLGPEGGGVPFPEESQEPTCAPKTSPSQGTETVDSGQGWALEFTSAFDGGNASVEAWDLESSKGGAPTFFTRVMPDFKANSASLRAFDQARQYWFFFGLRPKDPVSAVNARFRLKVGGMMRQEELYDNGYAPIYFSPSSSKWQRVEEGSVEYKREKDDNGDTKNTMYISWLHTMQLWDIGGTTYFAFCYPFSFADLQSCLSRLDFALGGESAPGTPLGCLWPAHAGSSYLGDHALEPPVTGANIYFHRQLFARSRQGRTIEMLTITEMPENLEELQDGPWDELPEVVQKGLEGWPSAPPLHFRHRRICFASGRVHPGETPGQFAFLGLLQFLLSNDPRAATLRQKFVWKLIPMMNPDGVAWGHSRTNSLGYDLNRCYSHATMEEHDVVFCVKAQLTHWKERGDLCWYCDMHAHGKDKGCFLYGNLQDNEDDFLWSVAYGHATQLNCPHMDIDKCLWSTAPAPKADQMDYDSGRGQIGRSCKLPLAYTLECNYNTGRLCRPVLDPPSLAKKFGATQAVREQGVPRDPAAGGRFAPVTYDPCAWANVGESLAVSVLDVLAENRHSRLLVGRPPKLITEVGGRTSAERAHQQDVLRRLDGVWEELARRHRHAGAAA